MDEQETMNCDNTSTYRKVEFLVADITDRALINGSLQRKNAMENNSSTSRIKDYLDYSFSNKIQNNFDVGVAFKQKGIGSYQNADKIINLDNHNKRRLTNDIILTPSMSSSEESDEISEYNEYEQQQKNPFFGMHRLSADSSNIKMNKSKFDQDMNDNIDTLLQIKNKSKNYLNIFYFIIKFKYLLKRFTSIRNIFTLKAHHFDLINDKSFGDQLVKKKKNLSIQKRLHTVLEYVWEYFTSIPVLDPSCSVVRVQEILSFLVILAQFFFLPIKTCFSITLINNYTHIILEILPPYYFFIEMIFIVNKGFYQEGIAVVDRISVFNNYFRTDFIVDFMTTGLLYLNQQNSLYSLFFLIRIPQLQKIFEKIILVAHICGCGFHYVGTHSDEQNNWIITKSLDQDTVIERYICSIYFAIIAMITVGFGDIVPINMYERIYVILQTCFSCGIFAFAINTIGNIVKEKQQQAHELKVNKNSVLSYMRDRNISKQNQYKVIRYLEYSHKNQNDIPSKGKEIIQGMSKSVRDGVYQEFFHRVINQMPLFQNRFSQKFKQEIQQNLNETVYSPGDCILTQGKASKNVYFIITGEVYQMIKMKDSSQQQQLLVQVLKQGDSFDEECFVSNLPCKYEYITKAVTQVAFIERSVFEEILSSYKYDYELFCMLVHEVRLGGKTIMQSQGCQSCKSKVHCVINCPLLHYEVNYDLFMKRYISYLPQKREPFMRHRQFKDSVDIRLAHKQLRLIRLRFPKAYQYNSQFTTNQEIFASETNQLCKLLEFDDEIFLTNAPKIRYSKTEDDIIFMHEEEDFEYIQEMYDEIDNSEDQSVDDVHSQQSKSHEDGWRGDRRNALLTLKKQTEETDQNLIMDQKEETINEINNEQGDNDYKKLNFAYSSDFSKQVFPGKQGMSSLMIRSSINNNDNMLNLQYKQIDPAQCKCKSLTNLNNIKEQNYQVDEENEDQEDEEHNIQNQKVNEKQKQKVEDFINYEYQTQGNEVEENNTTQQNEYSDQSELTGQQLTEQSNISTPKKTLKKSAIQQEQYNAGRYNNDQHQAARVQVPKEQQEEESQNNQGIRNSSLSGVCNEDSSKSISNNQNALTQIHSALEDIPFYRINNSDRLIPYQNVQNQVKSYQINNEIETLPQKRQSKLNYEAISLSNKAQSKIKNNNTQIQPHQSANSQSIKVQNRSSSIKSGGNIHQYNQNAAQKKNSFQIPQSQSNIQIGNNMIPNNNLNSRISIHLNEPLNSANQMLSVSNFSYSQIKELSSYSKRSINSGGQILKQQPQQSVSNNANPSSQNSTSNFYQQPQSTNQNFQYPQSQNQTLNKQTSLASISRQKREQTYITNKIRTNTATGTVIKSQTQSQSKQNIPQFNSKQDTNQEDTPQLPIYEKNLMIIGFDSMKIFQQFFPQYNIDKILDLCKLKFTHMRTSPRRQNKGGRKQKKRKLQRITINKRKLDIK